MCNFTQCEFKDFCAERSIQLKFATPAVPYQNVSAKALVKSCKKALKGAMGD